MKDTNLFYELTIGLFFKLMDLINILTNFLFYKFQILDFNISVWEIVGGVAIVALLVAWFVKKIVPVA